MKVGILGYGKMGRGIFGLFSATPAEVVVLDADAERVREGARSHEKRLMRSLQHGALDRPGFDLRMAGTRFTSDLGDLRGCDLVIECVFEDMAAKLELLGRVEAVVPAGAVIGSNTSSLSIGALAGGLRRPERFCGFHFFHPVQLTTVVEIITCDATAPATVAFLRGAARAVGRTPLVVRDLPGSVVNLLLACQYCEALYMLESGAALPSRIDAIAGRFCRVGPCESVDVIGIPFFTGMLARTLDALKAPFPLPGICRRLIADGRLGRQSNRGLYLYVEDRPVDDAPAYYLEPGQTHSRGDCPTDDASLADRLCQPFYFGLVYLASKGLGDVETLCMALRDLVGMPADPLAEVRRLGGQGLRRMFERLASEVGPRYDPAPFVEFLQRL